MLKGNLYFHLPIISHYRKPDMNRLLCIFLFLLLSGISVAQSVIVKGTLIDPLQHPVKKALISLENNQTTSNSQGVFFIRCDYLPNVLTIRHHDYALKEHFINFPEKGRDTLVVTIVLEYKHTELEEVVVTASRLSWAYPKPNVHIIDFDLWGENMLLLCKDKNNYLLRLVNADNDPVFDVPLRKHPRYFVRDCMDNVHIFYDDSVYQVEFISDTASLYNPRDAGRSKKVVLSCLLTVRSLQVYEQRGVFGQTVDLVAVDTLSHKAQRLYYVSNRKYRRALDDFNRELEDQRRSIRDQDADHSVDRQLEIYALKETQERYLELISKPVYVPIFHLRDSIVIFDHLNDSAVVFNNAGSRVRSFPIIYQHHRKWGEQLILNEEHTRIFARYNDDGMAQLREINPNNGELIRNIPITKHIYPDKIQCRGNYVYYLFHHYVDNSINYVYRQRID